MKKHEQNILSLLAERPRAAAELRQALGGISAATLSRLIARHMGRISVLGKARASTYSLPRDIREIGSRFPVYQINENGDARETGILHSLQGGYYCWISGQGATKLFRHLPWFIQDLRPDGFVGRAFAQRVGLELDLPQRLQDWNDDHVLAALTRRGEDIVGDLIIGEESLNRYFASTRQPSRPRTVAEYPQLAIEAMAGNPAGSSAGGEQPKFTALIERNDTLEHVLVKFSPSMSSEEGQRWADLLVCEHLALEVLRDQGIDSVISTLHQLDNRTFLEVVRFDRTGRHGRNPVNSLAVVDDEYFGYRDNWSAMADRLSSANMISVEDSATLRWIDSFGALIANTDRHFGNISLMPLNPERSKFKLAPVYDMLPMFYRPRSGEVPISVYCPPSVAAISQQEVVDAAILFWERAARDLRISETFRKICRGNLAEIDRLVSGPRLVGSNTRHLTAPTKNEEMNMTLHVGRKYIAGSDAQISAHCPVNGPPHEKGNNHG